MLAGICDRHEHRSGAEPALLRVCTAHAAAVAPLTVRQLVCAPRLAGRPHAARVHGAWCLSGQCVARFAGLGEMLVPLSMALLTDYDETYLGIKNQDETGEENPRETE